MANIIVKLDHLIEHGEEIKFQAPCDCTAVEGLTVQYPVNSDGEITESSKTFLFKDAHGKTVTGIGNLFGQGAIVKVILDVIGSAAYLQNADTNTYLESRLPHCVSIVLPSSGWVNNNQSITVAGVKADELAQVITPTPALLSQKAYADAGIRCTGQAANTLTFTANSVPTVNLTIHVIIQEVSV